MKITTVVFLLSSLVVLGAQSAFAENTKDKVLLDALNSEAEETSMEKDEKIEDIKDEPSVVPKAVTDYDALEKKVAAQIKGLLADSSKETAIEKEKSDEDASSDEKLKDKLENIVSSELLKGNKLDDIRNAVSAAMIDIKKSSEIKNDISKETLESVGKALKSIVAVDKSTTERVDIPNTVTVQVGENLYKIAQRVYGSGKNYLALFEANKDILKDPDLIRTGQVLKVPQ